MSSVVSRLSEITPVIISKSHLVPRTNCTGVVVACDSRLEFEQEHKNITNSHDKLFYFFYQQSLSSNLASAVEGGEFMAQRVYIWIWGVT